MPLRAEQESSEEFPLSLDIDLELLKERRGYTASTDGGVLAQLGASIVGSRQVPIEHGGDLWVFSGLGSGT